MKRGPSLTLRQALAYEPVELEFGTSGLRGLVKDITDLEAYVAVRAFLDYLLRTRGAAPGGPVCLAGDLRPSTESILVPVCRAVLDAGFSALSFGRIPSPALLFCAMKRGAPGIMVTGSHIPFDRNGIKLTRKDGEVLKPDEKPIREAMHSLRQREYGRPFADSMFDERGALKPAFRPSLPSASADAGEEYVKRYTSAFPPGILAGKRILVYQHSAVGRDILVRVLDELGARTIPAGRSDTFVAVDTEAVNQEMMAGIQALADAAGPLDAVVSTDGDSDRPLVLGVEGGRIRFYPGDVLGIVTADYLGARQIAVPVSVNDAVDIHFESRGVRPVKTRIGSPYVIAAMREVGWEANGGFLTAAPLRVPGGGMLSPLPTRDALLPILSALCAGPGSGSSLGELFSKLPPRFGGAALVRPFAQERGRAIVRAFSPADGSIVEARVEGRAPARWTVRRADGPPVVLDPAEPLSVEMDSIRDAIERCFTAREGFPPVLWMNWLDGVRIGFENSDITHVRPSGNAPEMRVYAAAGTPERAEAIAAGGAAPGGTLSLMDREAGVLRAVAGFRSSPSAVLLEGAVKHYSWGGFQYIPALIGRENPDRVPFAELWIGAHPVAPAAAVLGETRVGLDRLVAQAAREILGERDTARFGGRLPFLMKVLDARTMLSIQAHPTRAQAAAGFARENAAGIPLDSPLRTYRDDNHKPEVHVCLTEFWMLHGFRPLEEIGRVLADNPELASVMPDFQERLRSLGSAASRSSLLRDLYARVMTMPQRQVDGILGPLIARLEARDGGERLGPDHPGFWALRAAAEMPLPGGSRDRGIFSIYLMNLLHLQPGQGTYQPAGTLHAYLEGTNVECMASSDNVLRGGLTPKRVDTEELLRIVSFSDGHPPVLAGRMEREGVCVYETPAEEFVLERIDLVRQRPVGAEAAHGAECLVVIDGSAALVSKGRSLALPRGSAALAPAGVPFALEAGSSRARVFRARIPPQEGRPGAGKT